MTLAEMPGGDMTPAELVRHLREAKANGIHIHLAEEHVVVLLDALERAAKLIREAECSECLWCLVEDGHADACPALEFLEAAP